MKRSYLAYPYAVYAIVFLLIPLLLIVFYSFTVPAGGGGFEFTLRNYQRFFDSNHPEYMQTLIRSLRLALISTVICLALGYPMAYILAHLPDRIRNILSVLFVLPMWMNFLLRTYAWMTLLEPNGILNGILKYLHLPTVDIMWTEYAVVLGMVYNFLPFMILPIYNVLIKMDKSLLEASSDLGADFFTTFKQVIFPLSLPGVMSGITMVFMPAVTTFIISKLLGGTNSTLIGDLVALQFKTVANEWGFGSAMSVIMMVLVLVMMRFASRFEKEYNEEGNIL